MSDDPRDWTRERRVIPGWETKWPMAAGECYWLNGERHIPVTRLQIERLEAYRRQQFEANL